MTRTGDCGNGRACGDQTIRPRRQPRPRNAPRPFSQESRQAEHGAGDASLSQRLPGLDRPCKGSVSPRGKHRRIRMEDVMAYKTAIDREREAVLDQLVSEAQEQGMGYHRP